MTKEEARKYLLEWIQFATDPKKVPFMDEPCSDEEIILAMRIGADALSQPSLPSNLDKAAEAHRRKVFYGDPDYSQLLREAFKAGAEWMAGQSQKIDGDLEKEAEAYWKAQGGGSHAQWDKFRAVVKHFTEWQKEHIIEGL